MFKIKFSYLLLFAFLFILICPSAFCQVKIASVPGSPNPGAMLDVESDNRGFLPPRVFLENLTMKLNESTPIDGTIIFSTNWSGNESLGGLFVWKGDRWFPLNDSSRIPISHVRLVRVTNQALGTGATDIIWEQMTDNQQPTGDLPMWSSSIPNKVIIRRKGWYFVSASCRMDRVLVGDARYITIFHSGRQVTAAGFNPPGTSGTRNDITLHTSTMVFCEVGDEIALASFNGSAVTVTPAGLLTTQFSVTQLPNYPF